MLTRIKKRIAILLLFCLGFGISAYNQQINVNPDAVNTLQSKFEDSKAGQLAEQVKSGIEVLKQLQSSLEKGPIASAIKIMTDSAHINVYPMFHIAADSALWPYALELYFDVRAERKEPYILATLNFTPESGEWTDFESYKLSVSLTQGRTKAIPQEVILPVEKELNNLLANIGNLKKYIGQIRTNVADAIVKLRMAMMDKYWVGKNLPQVNFYAVPKALYGFDPPVQQAIIRKYKDFYRYDTVTLAPWKALSTSQQDNVSAYIKVRDTKYKKDRVRFVNRNGVQVQPTSVNNDTLVFSLSGVADNDEGELTAEYVEKDSTGTERKAPLAQVKTITYGQSPHSLQIISVNKASLPEGNNSSAIAKYLNGAYKQAVVTWDVLSEEKLEVKDWDLNNDGMLNIETSILQRYSDEEKAFITAWETTHKDSDPNAAYLFVVDMPNSLDARGYMPLNAHYGFVFTKSKNASERNEVYYNTMAHELGHGIFKMYHAWEDYGTPERQTNNLMDYQQGITLWKPQWDWMHDPGIRTYMFQSEEEGASITQPQLKCISDASNLGKLFIDPAGKTVELSPKQTPLAFFGEDEGSLYGRLAAYKENEKIFIYYLDNYTENFSGRFGDFVSVGQTNDVNKLVPLSNGNGKGILVQISNDCKLEYSQLQSCKCGFTISYKTATKTDNLKPGGKLKDSALGEIINFTGAAKVPDEEKLIPLINSLDGKSNIKLVLFATSNIKEPSLTTVKQRLAKPGQNELVIWADYDFTSKRWTIKEIAADDKGMKSKKGQELSAFVKLLIQLVPNLDSYTYFNPLTAILDGLTGLIDEAKIDERFYNPDHPKYNPVPAAIYAGVSLSIVKDWILVEINKDAKKYSPSRQDFAFICGVWNGLVGTLSGLTSGASLVIQLITNDNNIWSKLHDKISGLNWQSIKTMCGETWTKYTANPCMVSYGSGEVAFVIISFFIGAGEAKGVTSFVAVLDKLDVIGLMINKAIRISGGILKPVLNYSNKSLRFVLQKGGKLYKTFNNKRISVKVKTDALYCGIPALDIKISNKISELSEEELNKLKQEITNKLENEVDIPIDENGNKLIEVTIGVESTPVLVGTEEGLDKIENGIIKISDQLRTDAKNLIKKAIGSGTKFAEDTKTVEKLSEMMAEGSSFRSSFGNDWEGKLENLLKKNNDLRCENCGNAASYKTNLPSMDEMLDNANYFVIFKDKSGFEKVFNALISSENNRDGINHMISYMKKHASDFEEVTAFEFKYEKDLLRRADVAVGDVLYEFKSWTPGNPDVWNAFFKGEGESYLQFIDYLKYTKKLDNLKYVFNNSKADIENAVKPAFRKLFEDKKTDIFNALSSDLKQNLGIRNISQLDDSKRDMIINILIKSN